MKHLKTFESFKLNQNELLEEGLKHNLLAALISLSGVVGLAQKPNVKSGPADYDIQTAQELNNKLQSNDSDLVKYFDDADIELNAKNLEELKIANADYIQRNMTSYKSTATKWIAKGWTLKEIKITSDTSVSDLPQGTLIETNIETNLSTGNLFKSGEYIITESGIKPLYDSLQVIKNNGGEIQYIIIESSTDKQRVSNRLNKEITDLGYDSGNKGLSNLRNDNVKEYLIEQGIDGGIIEQEIKWEQGDGELGSETPQDESARYVKVTIVVVYDVVDFAPPTVKTIGEITETVYFVLVRPGEEPGVQKNDRDGKKIDQTPHGKLTIMVGDKVENVLNGCVISED